MASQSLYRKWRSQTFSDLVGQEAVTRTLLNAVRDGRLAHAYLFCGPRGTGKTSTARLLAKAVNCANPHDAEPCNECLSCREISAGRSPDVIEIDAASNTGVDNIRDLRETVNLLGSGGRYKLYIVDEVHMLSTAAFNALLKTLEEPPPHIIFVLATTEAHKVPLTVVSRCQRFDFRRIGMRDIVAHLKRVAEGEGLALDPPAADLIARAAQGGMRDALSLLDQAMAYCGASIDVERTRAMLGLADPDTLRHLIAHIAAQQSAEGLHLINELVTSGADLRQLNSQLAEELRALVLASAGADVAALMDRTEDEAREIQSLARRFTLDELAACARVFARNETPARGLPVPQLALELAFLECLTIKRNGGAPVAQTQIPTAAPPAKLRPPTPQPQASPDPEPVPASPPARAVAPEPDDLYDELDLDAIDRDEPAEVTRSSAPAFPPAAVAHPPEPTPVPAPDAPPPVAARPHVATPAPVAAVSGEAGALLNDIRDRWDLVKQVCKQKSRSVAALLHSARPTTVEPGDQLVVVLAADYQFHLDKLREAASRSAVEWALTQVIERPARVRVVLGNGNGGGANGGRGGSGPSRPGPSGPAGNGTGSGGPSAPFDSGPGAGPRGFDPDDSWPQEPVASNVRPFTGVRAFANGHVATPAAAVADVMQPYRAPNITPIRPDTSPITAQHSPESLEADVRADAVIQALLKTGTVELADVHPLDPDEKR